MREEAVTCYHDVVNVESWQLVNVTPAVLMWKYVTFFAFFNKKLDRISKCYRILTKYKSLL